MGEQRTLELPARTADGIEDSALFIGNATLLIRFAGFTILTDPNFIHRDEQVPLGYGLHATRQTDPALNIADLPPLDLVVLSHFHGDHFDRVAERDLDKSLPIVTTPEAAKELRSLGFGNAVPLETWETVTASRDGLQVGVTATPGRHGPRPVDFALPDVMGSILDFFSEAGDRLLRIYITGDTLAIDDLREIPQRYPAIDLAFLHLGGTRVMGVMVTMDGKQGIDAIRMVEPERAIPIHYDDYDVFTSPLADFQQEVEAAGLAARVTYLQRGERYALSPVPEHSLPAAE